MLIPSGVVEQQRQPIGGSHPEMVRALRTYLMVGFQLLVINRLAAGRTLDPQALRNPARLFGLRLDGFPGLLEPRHACTLASDAATTTRGVSGFDDARLAGRSSERSERPAKAGFGRAARSTACHGPQM